MPATPAAINLPQWDINWLFGNIHQLACYLQQFGKLRSTTGLKVEI